MGDEGTVNIQNPADEQASSPKIGAECGAVTARSTDLTTLIGLWPQLPESARSAIVTLATTSVISR
jgi:hypothetical protein